MSEIQNADIEWLDDGTPYSSQFNDIYFSSQGGPAESEHVFINGNDLAARWRQYDNSPTPFFIVELGFGTGLNFLLCWQLMERLALPNFRVHYLAFEKHPLSMQDLQTAQSLWPELESFSSRFLSTAIDHTAGVHRFCLTPTLTLDLYFGDALEGMSELLTDSPATVDSWFLDGFAPAKNRELWNESITKLMWRQSAPGTTASTYSVAGQVRRSLQKAGFTLKRAPGFGKKREMLRASVEQPTTESGADDTLKRVHQLPWRPGTRGKYPARQAIIVGAGFAGCSTAYSLVRKGWQVTLIDSGADIAAGASGNPQGVLQPRLAAALTVQSRFYVHALLFAWRQFDRLQQSGDIGWHPDGIIRLPDINRPGLSKILQSPQRYYDKAVLSALTAKQASEEAGMALSGDALYLPYGGWLRPVELCRSYLDSIASDLQLITRQEVTALHRQNNLWQAVSGKEIVAEAPVVVLSNSYLANKLPQTSFVPLRPVRGQLTQAAGNHSSHRLRKVVITEKYICPVDRGMHSIGASYQNRATDTTPSMEEDLENLQGIQQAFLSTEQLNLSADISRASVRCNAVDFFPVVGAVPDYQDFIKVFAPLKRNADARIAQTARFHPGLYINSGHGSYGIASCPLSGEYLASLISGECLPLSATMARSISPARFIIRALKKQQVNVDGMETIDQKKH